MVHFPPKVYFNIFTALLAGIGSSHGISTYNRKTHWFWGEWWIILGHCVCERGDGGSVCVASSLVSSGILTIQPGLCCDGADRTLVVIREALE